MFNKSNVVLSLVLIAFILLLVGSCSKKPTVPVPLPTGTVTDIDGNIYPTIGIGTQEWMVENLKVTHYRNGDDIPNVTDSTWWFDLRTGAYCNYNNDTSYVSGFGRLYNWYAVDDTRSIAPEGWHVPTDAEWQTLIDYLGGDRVAGGKMKDRNHWNLPNIGATNESGFSALPGGCLGDINGYDLIGTHAYFWESTEMDSIQTWCRVLNMNYSWVNRVNGGYGAISVRCIKD